MIIHGDSLEKLKDLESNSVDLLCTDPPYGYSFMGKAWDKVLPDIGIWKQCLRVLKPGAFAFVMSAPRSDVQSRMALALEEAGFVISFTPIYWTYASGFPKAMNIGKKVEAKIKFGNASTSNARKAAMGDSYRPTGQKDYKKGRAFESLDSYEPKTIESNEAKALDGSYGGFQPKPAVEVIIVCMKPLSEKTYVDQALKNGKGITWLDDCRVPITDDSLAKKNPHTKRENSKEYTEIYGEYQASEYELPQGRFPANILVSDDVLNDGVDRTASFCTGDRASNKDGIVPWNQGRESGRSVKGAGYSDGGGFSRYFSLDKWSENLPFLIVPKASKREKNKGLEEFEDKERTDYGGFHTEEGLINNGRNPENRQKAKNGHPTVKPLKLMSYLITLGSRPGDTILDPFCGSGTTCVAAKELGREFIGIEREADYVKIAEARIEAVHIPSTLPI